MSLKQLRTQTLIYGAGHLISRLVNFILLPLFTHTISIHDYGIVSLIFVFIAFLNILFLHGMDSALLRFYGMETDQFKRIYIYSTSWWWVGIITLIITIGILFFSSTISIFTVGIEYNNLIILACGIAFFDTLSTQPKILLRLQNKPLHFITIELIHVILIVVLNILWLGIQGKGVEYIFISNLIASAFSTSLLLLININHHKVYINKQFHIDMIKFALPYIPAGIASMTNELIDRYIIKWILNENAVGLYSAGYKLGIFMLVVTMGFKFAWQPFFLDKSNEKNSYKIFSKAGTWFVVISSFIFLSITFFINNIVRLSILGIPLLGADYWQSTSIVPIVLLAYVFLGIFTIQLAGIYIKKQNKWIPIITSLGAVVNILCNIIFIKNFGWEGAAWATLIGYMCMVVLQYFIVSQFYPLEWEWKRLTIIIFVTSILFFSWKLAGETLVIGLINLSFYPLFLWVFGFFSFEERKLLEKSLIFK